MNWLRRRGRPLPRYRDVPARAWKGLVGRRSVDGLEELESRALLAVGVSGAHVLDCQQGSIDQPGGSREYQLSIGGGGPETVLGIVVRSVEGSALDPAAPQIVSSTGQPIEPLVATNDLGEPHDGAVLVGLPQGEFTVTVSGQSQATGGFLLEIYLPGDADGDGLVTDAEWMQATAAAVQAQGQGSHLTRRLFASRGFELSQDQYQAGFDVNQNGDIDSRDLDWIERNLNQPRVQSVVIIEDDDAPAITAALRSDTGRSDVPASFSDGITGDASGDVIVGTVTDLSDITRFQGSIDSTDAADFADVSFNPLTGAFGLSLAQLEQLFSGGSLANSGRHTLFLVGEDERGNVTAAPLAVEFQIDTVAPAAPTGLDLVDASDLGFSNTDNLTADNTPTISATAESGALVELLESGVVVGQGVSSGTASVTTSTLADGTRTLTARATDIAGNVSAVSDSLAIEIETVPPEITRFELRDASDTGAEDGITSLATVDFGGLTREGGMEVRLVNTGQVTFSGTGLIPGTFTFDGVPITFGENEMIVIARDEAGNEAEFRLENGERLTVIRDNDPAVDQPLSPVAVSESAAPLVIDLSDLFTDADFADGDQLTIDVSANTNSALVTTALTDQASGDSIVNDRLTLTFASNVNGTAQITIRATDSFGQRVTSNLQVTVNAVNSPPQAESTTLNASEATAVDLDLRSLASDVETPDDSLTFAVDSAVGGTVVLLPDGFTARFTPDAEFEGAGSYVYRVTDTGDGSASPITSGDVSITVNVAAVNDPPQANGTTLTTDEDQAVEIDLRSLVSDTETPDAGLTFTVGGGMNGNVVLLGDGHTARFTPAENFNSNRGSAQFVYSVTDTGDGSAAPITVSDVVIAVDVDPVNDPPQAVADGFTVPFDEPTGGLNVLSNDLDVDLTEGDTLTVVAVDSTTTAGALVTLGAGNTLNYDPNGRFDSLQPGQSATDTFSYTIRDAGGSESTATVTMTVVTNQPPLAEDDASSTDEDTPLSIDVLADNGNGPDTDPDGDDLLLEVSQVDATSERGAAVVIQGDGTLRYDPMLSTELQGLGLGGFVDDTFQYTVLDADGATDVATVTIRVVGRNDQPVARDDEGTTDEDTPLSINVLANNGSGADSDADAADVLAVTSFDEETFLGASVTQLGDGTLRYDPSSALGFLADDQEVEDTFTYSISDGKGGAATATVRITVSGRNDNPLALDDTASTDENTAINIDVLDNDTDPDAADLPVVATFPATSNLGAAVSVNGDGTLRYDPTGVAAINALAAGQSLTDSFVYSIADGNSGVDSATVTITLAGRNDPPLAVDDGGQTDADEVLAIDVLDNDSDPDSADTLSITNVAASSARGAAVSLNGDGTLRYDPRGSSVLGQLAAGQQLVDTFTYTVSDGHAGSSSTATVTVLVTGVNDPPQAVDDLGFSVDEASEENVLDVLANDSFAPDVGETLTIVSVSSGSAGGTIEIGVLGQSILYTPSPAFSGTETFSYTIEDNGGASDTATVSVNVVAAVDQVRFRLETTNLGGNPISSVPVGSEFQLRVYVQDIRPEPEGVFAGFLDVVYDTGHLTATEDLVFGPQYQNTASGNGTVDGLIDEVGAADGITPLGGGEFLLFMLQFRADAGGTVTFVGEPADLSPANDIVLFGVNNAVSDAVVQYGSVALQITGGAPGDSATSQAIDEIAADVAEAWTE